ncbi:MAG: hypothetical protein Q8Q49_05135 [bacterium]|nr:hypothetical protein [bacterium]
MSSIAKSIRVLPLLGSIVASFVLVGTAFAAEPTNTTKPGWGFGDKNHVHIGPPGISVRVDENISKEDDDTVDIENDVSAKGNADGSHIVVDMMHSVSVFSKGAVKFVFNSFLHIG